MVVANRWAPGARISKFNHESTRRDMVTALARAVSWAPSFFLELQGFFDICEFSPRAR